MNRRRAGRSAAAVGAVAAFAWAGWAAHASAMPELRIYDGYRIILGATVAVIVVAPFIWRWRRDRSLLVIAIAAVVGSVIPLILSAMRNHMSIVVRLRGSWNVAGADLVGPAVVVGFVCLWLAIREWSPGGETREGRKGPR
jgi:RsiW-degrading membrane proteinase PrsW (M82 family)